jgi:hypothetical protein
MVHREKEIAQILVKVKHPRKNEKTYGKLGHTNNLYENCDF